MDTIAELIRAVCPDAVSARFYAAPGGHLGTDALVTRLDGVTRTLDVPGAGQLLADHEPVRLGNHLAVVVATGETLMVRDPQFSTAVWLAARIAATMPQVNA